MLTVVLLLLIVVLPLLIVLYLLLIAFTLLLTVSGSLVQVQSCPDREGRQEDGGEAGRGKRMETQLVELREEMAQMREALTQGGAGEKEQPAQPAAYSEVVKTPVSGTELPRRMIERG